MKFPIRPGALAGILVLVGVAVAVTLGLLKGLALAVLALATLALLGVVALLSASVRGLSGGTPLSLDEAVGLGAPSAEEEQKRAVLRALKDLEYERSVGKISEEDYREFSARYREEARRLIARVDEALAQSRGLAEQLLSERFASAGLAPSSDATAPEESTDGAPESTKAAPEPEPAAAPKSANDRKICAKCEVTNEPDAHFCKGCGAPLGGGESEATVDRPAVAEEAGS